MEFIYGCMVALTVSVIVAANVLVTHAEVVKHQCAHYDEHTGAFTWNQEAK